VKILIDRPDPNAFPGYTLFFAVALLFQYDMPCNGQELCISTEPLPVCTI
jgi:hypothetical protein